MLSAFAFFVFLGLMTLAWRREDCWEGWTGLINWVLAANSLARAAKSSQWLDEVYDSFESDSDEESEEDDSEDELSSELDELTDWSLSLSITAMVLF